jgi:hypothetical protein
MLSTGEMMTILYNSKSQANPLDMNHPRKAWRKPVLDILELETAQHGKTHINDGSFTHRSY